MKTSLLSLLGLAGVLLITGCASENEQGGSYGTTESSRGQYISPHNTPDSPDKGDYWARDYYHTH